MKDDILPKEENPDGSYVRLKNFHYRYAFIQ